MKAARLLILAASVGLVHGQVQTDPSSSDIAGSYYHFSLAKLHELNEEFGQAIAEFERAIALNPRSIELRVEFAEALLASQNIRRAVEECRKAIELDPQNAGPHFLLGKIYASSAGQQEEMLDQAFQEFKRAAELDPSHHDALFNLAQLQFMKNDYESAIRTLADVLELQPWAVTAYGLKAKAHLEMDQPQEAIQTLEAAMAYDDAYPPIVKQLGELYERARQWDKAIEVYSRLVEVTGDEPDLQLRLSVLLIEEKRFGEAVPLLEELIENFPSHNQTKVALGQALKGDRKYARAAEIFEDVLSSEPDQFRSNYELAETLVLLGRREEALERFRNLLDRSETAEDRMRILTNLAFIRQDMRQYDEAIEIFREILEENPEDDISKLRLAYLYKDAGQLTKALDLSAQLYSKYEQKTEEEEPNKPFFVVGRAQMLSAADRLKEAVAILRKEIEGASEPEQFYLAASQLYMDHKQYRAAEEIVEEGLSQLPNNERLKFQRAAVFERQGKIEEAEKAFKEILQLNPDHAGVLNYLGYMLADRAIRLEEALGYIDRAVELEPHNGAYLDSLGWVYFRLGRLDEAEENLLEAIRLNHTDSTIHDHLGDLYFQLGKLEEARKHYRRSISFSTEDEERQTVQKKLDELETRLSRRTQ